MIFELSKTELVVSDAGERRGVMWWRLERDLSFFDESGVEIVVPAGFETDFASVPRILWWLFPPQGRYSRAAVIHDYLYRRSEMSRFLADAIFREAMAQLDVPLWKRVVMYYAVRCCGWACRTEPVR